jgi:hypothetical protein
MVSCHSVHRKRGRFLFARIARTQGSAAKPWNLPTYAAPPLLLEATKIHKAYGGVRALDDVSLALRPGEIHALVGENGAGKSTLIKVLSGSVRADAGSVTVAGQSLAPGDVASSQAAGIAVIHQESTAFPFLSAEDNVFVAENRGAGRAGCCLTGPGCEPKRAPCSPGSAWTTWTRAARSANSASLPGRWSAWRARCRAKAAS